jgi:hypothetical protein
MAEKKPIESAAKASELGVGVLRPGTMKLVVQEGIAAKDLHAIVDRVINLHGCTNCGLGGIDLLVRVRDQMLFDRFKDIQGLHDVTLMR